MSYGSFEMNGTSVPGGPKPALDTIGGVDFQLIKIGTGGEGAFLEIGAGNPLPVTFPGGVELAAGAEVEVTACALPTGAATEATLASALAALGDITTPSDTQPISAAALPLPAGAATQATLASILALLVGGRLSVDGSGVTQPVSAASLPLPTGAATETTLSALNTKVATAKTADYDTGGGTDTVQMLGLALPASGGAVAGGTSTNPVRTDPTGTTTQPTTERVGQIIDENGTTRTVSRSFLDTSSSGDQQVVAAQGSGVRVRVLAVYVHCGATATSVRFRSATTSISSLKALAANGGFVLPLNEHGWFQTATNEALNINLSAANAIGVEVVWCQAT